MKAYLDYAATTPLNPQVLKAMMPYFKEKFGNASSLYFWGQEAKKAVEKARGKVAEFLGAKPEEIFFTSCATESINWSHRGLIENIKRPHIITSSVEHKAVLETGNHLEKGKLAEVTYLKVDKYGRVRVRDIEKAIRPETVLISVMYVNNEVGTIEPVEEIGKLVRKVRRKRKIKMNKMPIFFHTDATQAIQYLDCDVGMLGVDFLSLTGHKFYAPKGVGALFIKKGVKVTREQDGGGQESGMRAGTENVAYIVGLGKAIEQVTKKRQKTIKRVARLRNKLINGVLERVPGVKLLGHPNFRAPHIASFIVGGVEGEAMVLALSDKGIAVSSGSACTETDLKPSHVLLAMGVKPEKAHGSLRVSLGKDNNEKEVDYFLEVFPKIIKKLRKMAPEFRG